MLEKQISLNSDLQKLCDEGYEVFIDGAYLIISSVPYLNSEGSVELGAIATDLHPQLDHLQAPRDHQVWFDGTLPHTSDGKVISALSNVADQKKLNENFRASLRFSCKPEGGYPSYFEKMESYVKILSHPVKKLYPVLSAKTYRTKFASANDPVFQYRDSASTRVGITGITSRLAQPKVAIVGLGGTGSYILDGLAKTPVQEIHLFDGDIFEQHNAFRSPGAPSAKSLLKPQMKVAYFSKLYGHMHKGISKHPYFLDDQNVDDLEDFDFVFISVDSGHARSLIGKYLIEHQIPFIDVGMGLDVVDDKDTVFGTCRVTLVTPEQSDHYLKRVNREDGFDEIYASNIQIADVNMLNASMALLRWKKYLGFYADHTHEHSTAYSINSHTLTRDDTVQDNGSIDED